MIMPLKNRKTIKNDKIVDNIYNINKISNYINNITK